MLAILYPKDDNLAREVAVKVGLNYDNVYIAPTYRISEKYVIKELEKAKFAILIMFESNKLDKKTLKRLNFLKERVDKILAFVPSSVDIDNDSKVLTVKYDKIPAINDESFLFLLFIELVIAGLLTKK